MRQVTKAGVGKHLAIAIKSGGEHGDPSLKIPVHRNPWGTRIPVISIVILKCVPVAGAGHKTSGLIGHRIVGCIRERSEWMIPCVDTIGIYIILGSRSPILQIVFSFMLGHPCTFHKRCNRGAMIATEALPTVLLRMKGKQSYVFAGIF